ncbi:MAG: peptidyl-prolyl cis-trans isomerase-like 1 [Candidatus Peregrinibacteria bacterium Greene1014_49]|nr:MAG: peptidyl-prolyl cis-trans isomerase-like 1 [Candidatus Peregrinibacteria bacterium Greene1014_49]
MTTLPRLMWKFIVPLFALALLVGCSPAEQVKPVTPPTPSVSSTPTMKGFDGKMLTGKFIVVLSTSEGDITVEIDADAAPKTATNFIVLAQSGYYDQLTFHRVIPGFMIQGGDPNGNGTGGNSVYGETFEDETDDANALMAIGYKAGVIAMANRGPDTNGSQFFIMDANYDLPPNYTIFGHVTAGQKVVNAIARVEKSSNDMPVEPVTFSVEVR